VLEEVMRYQVGFGSKNALVQAPRVRLQAQVISGVCVVFWGGGHQLHPALAIVTLSTPCITATSSCPAHGHMLSSVGR
jgi:hypothetical protein